MSWLSNKITRCISAGLIGFFAGYQFYDAIEAIIFGVSIPIATLYLIGYGLVFVVAIVLSILKAVLKINALETFLNPLIVGIVFVVFAVEYFMTGDPVSNVLGAISLVAFLFVVAALVLFVLSDRKLSGKYDFNKLPKSFYTVACVILLVFSILLLIGSIGVGHPLFIVFAICLIVGSIISAVDVWTFNLSPYEPSSKFAFGNKFKVNFNKKSDNTSSSSSNNTSNPNSPKVVTLEDLKNARTRLEREEITLEEYEKIKKDYMSRM